MRPKRHTVSASAQVSVNSPTITYPTVLRSTWETQAHAQPLSPSWLVAIDSSSIEPTRSATATESPVIVRL